MDVEDAIVELNQLGTEKLKGFHYPIVAVVAQNSPRGDPEVAGITVSNIDAKPSFSVVRQVLSHAVTQFNVFLKWYHAAPPLFGGLKGGNP
ncbi:MAG: hypothetical protein J4203_05665 [Candidatus Diapherotrites archaeon]|uniref:Uncharacterized protein n=1 Tax=Candidatus Iainarchaeum sp. TaxID=3101447 RepID=A0A8T4L8U1_9ARCH|nr:hypothetical protein [Candidatus Diapherotrites archaeon]